MTILDRVPDFYAAHFVLCNTLLGLIVACCPVPVARQQNRS